MISYPNYKSVHHMFNMFKFYCIYQKKKKIVKDNYMLKLVKIIFFLADKISENS